VTTVQALLRTLARHEREPFYLRMDVVEYAGGEEAEAALLFADAMDDVPFMDDVAEEILRCLRIAASMAMSEAAGRGVAI
jgi:truncated hemoglobin YjbI